MSEKYKYSKYGLRYAKPLIPRKYQLDCMKAIGCPRDPDIKFNDEVRYDIASALATLSAVFDADHPDNKEYSDINLKLNHLSLWLKISEDLETLIDDVIAFNRPEPMEVDDID